MESVCMVSMICLGQSLKYRKTFLFIFWVKIIIVRHFFLALVQVVDRPHLFANKFINEVDPFAKYCLTRYLRRKMDLH